MRFSLIGALVGAVLGTIVGALIAGMSFQLGDTSSISLVGRGVIVMIGTGLGAVAGAIVGSTTAILDALRRGRPAPW